MKSHASRWIDPPYDAIAIGRIRQLRETKWCLNFTASACFGQAPPPLANGTDASQIAGMAPAMAA